MNIWQALTIIVSLLIAIVAIIPGVYAVRATRKAANAVALVDNRKVELDAYRMAQGIWEDAIAGVKVQLKDQQEQFDRVKAENKDLKAQVSHLHDQVQFLRGALQANGITLPRDLS